MAIIATGSKTIIDLSDGKSLSAYLGSNQPRVQINDVNAGTYTPDWTTAAGKLVITPVVYANQTAIDLSDSNLTITWKRKTGSGSEAALEASETVSGNILTVTANKLTTASGNVLTYIAYVTYKDPETTLPINAAAQIDFALVTTGEHAKTAWISGEQVFKYDSDGNVTPTQITLTANLQNVTMSKWQYKNDKGVWTDYPTTSDNASINGTTLIVKPGHSVFVGTTAAIRIVTSDANISDSTSLYKVSDGTDGSAGEAGKDASVVFLTNENMTFAGNANGQVSATTVQCNVVAYKGTTKVTPTVDKSNIAIEGCPEGEISVNVGDSSNNENEIPLTIAVTDNATLGDSGQRQGTISVPITSPVSTTLKIQWSKVNTGATGQDGKSAVVFALYAPDGEVFVNQQGELTIETQAYIGSTKIESGATYEWAVYSSGNYVTLTGETGSSLTVCGDDVNGVATYRCTMTYDRAKYTDIITLTDKTDNFQATIESTGGDIFKNTQGNSTLTCRLFQNGTEVDTAGTQYVYTWYRMDKDGNPADKNASGEGIPFTATGITNPAKSISITGDHVDVKTTFICNVTKKTEG